ncbi:hypothetical protein EMEDMD4_580015 [Sinorhizobium medicae]|uniref:Uncharacterized protein n=1 Tax=Sinorhizobium medicae TaxID=110321 RepID=A0A508X620_9HYPH|nr:hypothetical protein EMEDMD4_580015 [Sinorhizobium medicae]
MFSVPIMPPGLAGVHALAREWHRRHVNVREGRHERGTPFVQGTCNVLPRKRYVYCKNS